LGEIKRRGIYKGMLKKNLPLAETRGETGKQLLWEFLFLGNYKSVPALIEYNVSVTDLKYFC